MARHGGAWARRGEAGQGWAGQGRARGCIATIPKGMNVTIQKDPRNDADVALLLKVFADILPDGRKISHEQIETVLRLNRASSRYRTIVTRWRRLIFVERRVFLDGRAAEGAGFVALTPDEMVRYANREVRASGKKLKKAIAVASAPNDDELSADMLRYRRLLEAATVKIAAEHRHALKDVSKALAPMKQLPRVAS